MQMTQSSQPKNLSAYVTSREMGPARDINDDPENLPRSKKQKVAIACDRCRSKKIKCDGIQPVCGPCVRQAGELGRCSWYYGLSRVDKKASRDHIVRLEKQIKELHQHKNDLTSSLDATMSPQDDGVAGFEREEHGSWQGLEAAWPKSININQSEHDSSVRQNRPDYEGVDPVSVLPSQAPELTTSPANGSASGMIGSVAEDDNYRGLFGSSSTGSFISVVRRVVNHNMESSGQQHGAVGKSNPHSLRTTPWGREVSKANSDAYLLPPRRRTDALLAIYWDKVYPLYPLVDRKCLEQRYNEHWNGQEYPFEAEFLCMLNAIFATSTQIDATLMSEERKSVSEAFFRRAQGLLDLWSPGSVQMVQIFLLLAQYLQTTNEPHQCWMFVGHAVRTAQSLGLHMKETIDRMSSISQRELSLRVWHGCIQLDRILAMTYGRPTMIKGIVAAAAVRPLSLDDDEILSHSLADKLPNKSPQVADFFVHSIGLFEILDEILEEFYDPRYQQQSSFRDDHEIYFRTGLPGGRNSILDIDQKLLRWEKALPEHLRNYRAAPEVHLSQQQFSTREKVFIRQAVVLRQRFLHIRLLSLRPILASFVAREVDDSCGPLSTGSSLPRRLAHQCSLVCCMTAQEAIDLVYSNRATIWSPMIMTATWWYNVFYVYSAATVLIAARLKNSIVSELTEASIQESWGHAIDILQGYYSFSDSIPKLVATLHVLSNKVPVRYSNQVQQRLQGSNHTSNDSTFNPLDIDGQENQVFGRLDFSNFSGRNGYGNQNQQFADVADLLVTEAISAQLDAMPFDPDDLSWLNAVPFDP